MADEEEIVDLSTTTSSPNNQQERGNRISRTSAHVMAEFGRLNERMGDMTQSIQQTVEARTGDLKKPNYKMMAISLGVGFLFLVAAMASLPMVLISPGTFNMYFSLSSTCFLISVSFYYGPLNYISTLFERKNILMSIIYLSCSCLSFYSMVAKISYLWTILLVLLQGCAFVFFVLQIFTGYSVTNSVQEGLINTAARAVGPSLISSAANAWGQSLMNRASTAIPSIFSKDNTTDNEAIIRPQPIPRPRNNNQNDTNVQNYMNNINNQRFNNNDDQNFYNNDDQGFNNNGEINRNQNSSTTSGLWGSWRRPDGLGREQEQDDRDQMV